MSQFRSPIDALLEWERMKEDVTVYQPEPLRKEKRKQLEVINANLNTMLITASLRQSLMTLWSAVENEQCPPSKSDLSGGLLQCSEAAQLILNALEADDAITYRLKQADLYEAQHGGQQSRHMPTDWKKSTQS